MRRFQTWVKQHKRLPQLMVFAAMMVVLMAAAAAQTSPSLSINFDVSQMFSWAQTIINALLPVVYVTMGIGLGFLIIRALRSAFN